VSEVWESLNGDIVSPSWRSAAANGKNPFLCRKMDHKADVRSPNSTGCAESCTLFFRHCVSLRRLGKYFLHLGAAAKPNTHRVTVHAPKNQRKTGHGSPIRHRAASCRSEFRHPRRRVATTQAGLGESCPLQKRTLVPRPDFTCQIESRCPRWHRHEFATTGWNTPPTGPSRPVSTARERA
jgi:hypothetical protein